MKVPLALASTLALIVSVAPAHAASSIQVTTSAQDGSGGCSLGEAIISANNDSNAHAPECVAGSGADTIVLPEKATLTMNGPVNDADNYLGATATPMISSTIVIEAAGAKIVHGGGPVPYRAFAVGEGGDLTIHEAHIKGFEVHGGNGGGGGGGGLGAGGAIYVHAGTLGVGWSTFEQNGAIGGNGSPGNFGAGGGGGGVGGDGGAAEHGGGGGGG